MLDSDHACQDSYEYNNLESLEQAAEACKGNLAAVVVGAFDYRYSRLEAVARRGRILLARDQALPTRQFAEGVRALCDRTGALLVLDDVRAGFRLEKVVVLWPPGWGWGGPGTRYTGYRLI